MKVITSGARYLDIDAYGGCVAYAELLNLLGQEAVAATTAPLNESITATIRSWHAPMTQDYVPRPDDTYTLIDVSDPEAFDTFVDQEKIIEIIDHHMEFADYWQAKLGDRSQIEFIGAACTLVYEKWQQAEKLDQISEVSARLLIAGILDNTLNFRASVTTERDHTAYAALLPLANLTADWSADYFTECQQAIVQDLPTAIVNDIKQVSFPSRPDRIAVGQLVVWDAQVVVQERLDEMRQIMSDQANEWFMSIVSIAEGKNYLLASDTGVQSFLEKLLGVDFTNSMATTDRLWLRKEIMKKDLDGAQ